MKLQEELATKERQVILATLELFHGNRKHTAEHLEMPERTLRYKLAKYKQEGYDVYPFQHGGVFRRPDAAER